MTAYDWLLIAVIAVGAFFAVRSAVRRKKKGGCSGNCSACSGCSATERPSKDKE